MSVAIFRKVRGEGRIAANRAVIVGLCIVQRRPIVEAYVARRAPRRQLCGALAECGLPCRSISSCFIRIQVLAIENLELC